MLRIATIGTSWITTRFAAAAAEVPGIELAVAYSRDRARAAEFAREIGAGGASSDLVGLLGSTEVDAVYVASPNSVHFEQALTAVRAGKHVLVEKPAATTAAEFQTLIAAAEQAGVVLLEAMRSAYDPGVAKVSELLGELGTLRRASIRYGKRSSRYDQVLAGERVNIFDPALAGGALYDLGVYCTSALVSLFGEPGRVLAASVPIAGGADGAGAVLAVYPGLVVDLSYSKITDSGLPSEFQGELGTLTVDSITAPRRLELRRSDGTEERHEVSGPEFNLGYEIERFIELCSGTGDASADQARTLATLRVLDAIRSAAVPAV